MRVDYAWAAAVSRSNSELDFFLDIGNKLVNGQTNLLHCVPVANGDGVLLHIVGGIAFSSFKINCYAERGTDFVLAAITLADCTGLIVIDHEMLGQIV